MTRFYSSLPLNEILRLDLEEKERLRKETEVVARRTVLTEKCAARAKTDVLDAVDEPPLVAPMPFFVESLEGRWVFGPVLHRGAWYRVSLTKKQLEAGVKHSQEWWGNYLKHTDLRLGSVPLQVSYLSALIQASRGEYQDLIAEMHDELIGDYDSMNHVCAMTGSRICFSPSGLDMAVHEYGTPEAHFVPGLLHGIKGLLTFGTGCEGPLEVLAGTRDVAQINGISQWLRGVNTYLACDNNPSPDEQTCALVLGLSGDRFFIISDPDDKRERPARGMALEKIMPMATEAPR